MRRHQQSVAFCKKHLIALCAATCLATTFTHNAQAQEPIILVNPPALLAEATSKALVAWKLQLRSITTTLPSESMPSARDGAQALSNAHQARAVVWLTSNADGPALWVYDADDDRVAVRRLSVMPPFDEAAAASVALSIKTLLMHSQMAPQAKRFGAAEASSVSATQQVRPRQTMTWFFEAQGLARHSAANDQSLELRVNLGLTHLMGPMEFGASVILGPGRSIADREFRGHYSDLAFATHLRYRLHWQQWTISPSVGMSLHSTKISGTLSESEQVVAAGRFNPSLAAAAFVIRDLQGVRLGISVHSNLFLRSQRYLVKDDPVLDLPTVDLAVGTYVALPFR